MAGQPTEGGVSGSALSSEYSADTNNSYDRDRPADPSTVKNWLSEWTDSDATVRRDGSVVVPSEEMPLPRLDAARQINDAGWRFDGYEGHNAVYRRDDQ